MPILNGDSMADSNARVLDYATALDVLKNEYPERDGIDIKTLTDSRVNGGLTYNDFLILPGYIGTSFGRSWNTGVAQANIILYRLSCF